MDPTTATVDSNALVLPAPAQAAPAATPPASAPSPVPDFDKITLGGKTFRIRPLTLLQLKTILPAFTRAGAGGAIAIDASIEIIHAALRRDDPALTVEEVANMEATVPDMTEAVDVIARLAGLVQPGE